MWYDIRCFATKTMSPKIIVLSCLFFTRSTYEKRPQIIFPHQNFNIENIIHEKDSFGVSLKPKSVKQHRNLFVYFVYFLSFQMHAFRNIEITQSLYLYYYNKESLKNLDLSWPQFSGKMELKSNAPHLFRKVHTDFYLSEFS